MWRRVLGACVLFVAAATVAPPTRMFASEWLTVDACLDSGGSFNYAAMECDHVTNHPYVSFERRHPGRLHSLRVRASVCAPVGLLGLALLVWPKRRAVS